MKTRFWVVPLALLLAIASACQPIPVIKTDPSTQEIAAAETVSPTEPPPPIETALPPATDTPAPTETLAIAIRFISPAEGATIDYDAMIFQISPVPGADGYAWIFIQNGKTIWNTIKNEMRLSGPEYSILPTGSLYEKFSPGELQVQVKARIGWAWSDPTTLTVYLPERENPTPTSEPYVTPTHSGPVEVRWFVGVGAGTDANQQAIENKVVNRFNETHADIKLTLQVVNYDAARDSLIAQFKEGKGPDIVGPMGWYASSVFRDQWLDLSNLIAETGYDLSVYQPELMAQFKLDEELVGMPFCIYPAAIFYNKKLFDNADLSYPPAAYGEPYLMPDGTKVEWSWDTLTEVARLLTLDAQGRNANDPNFDRANIVQYGFYAQYQVPTAIGSFWGSNRLYDDRNNAVIPPEWEAAWKWYFDGMWGEKRFIPNGPAANTPRLGYGNPFSTAYVAMAATLSWYIGPNVAGGQRWDLGALPTYQGVVHGRMDADTFRIWKGTRYPRETFEVLTYFLGEGSEDLLRAYGGVPARTAEQDAWFTARAQQYPFVKNWEVLKAGLAYPDVPSAEGYMPNFIAAWIRLTDFGNLMASRGTISIDAEIDALRRDLDSIFKR